jgi:kumamolisin
MKRLTFFAFLSFAIATSLLGFTPTVSAQGHVMTPKSSLPQPLNAEGKMMARTHLRIFVPSAEKMNFGKGVQPSELPPFPGFFFETPASLACVYRLVPNPVPGCNPNATTANPSGGSHVIALVDAFDDPTAASDLAAFSAQFGLATPDLTVVYATGAEPGLDPTGGWELEEAVDTQWAHSMAPGAKLFLVEAPTNSLVNLFSAVIVASKLVAAAGGGEVSMSWGTGEATEETLFDSLFTTPGVVYLASAGDSPGVEYPSASPNVVSAGGTSISRNAVTGNFVLESAWQDAGGGASQVEPRPSFQDFVRYVVGSARGTPDLSFDSNPTSGVWVFNSNPVFGTGWFVVGGTSVASASLVGIINSAGGFRASSRAENEDIYSHMLFNRDDFRDIYYGNCGVNVSNFAFPGYDLCTGVGSDLGLRGK